MPIWWAATGSDGVHVGQEDMPARQARTLIGPDLTLGVTCKGSRDLAMQAGEDGADYVAFGAFFPSATKEVKHLLDPEILAWWSEMMELPCLRHRRHHAGELRAAGAGGDAIFSPWLVASGTIRMDRQRG